MSKPIKMKSPDSTGTNKGRPKSSMVPVHESTAAIPQLDSAPPSGNYPMDHPLSNIGLPPPPPPPPLRMGTVQQAPVAAELPPPQSTTATNTPPPTSAASSLPPPPRVSPIVAPLSSTTAVPLPPPPPPPPHTREEPPTEIVHENDTSLFPPRSPSPPPFRPLAAFPPHNGDVLALRQSHVPILVIATEAANHLAWKNSLRLTDLFQGIVRDMPLQQGSSHSPPTPFRSVHKSLFPTHVRVRFVEPSQMDPLSYQQAHDLLSDNAKIQDADGNVAQDLVLLEDRVDDLLQDRSSNETLAEATKDAFALTSPLDIPWLVRYRLALDKSTDALPHDLINCPPLVLLVCTTQEIEPPLEVLQELYNSPHVLPDAFKNGLYDPQAMRHEVLVLHDNNDGPSGVDDSALRQALQAQFGPNSAMLRINSVLPGTAAALAEQEEKDIWGGDGKLGNYLSVNDRVLLRRYFQSILTTALLPALERRISDLNAIVSERKKGVKNLVKSFWRKPKEETASVSSYGRSSGSDDGGEDGVKYRYDSVESQTRLLADTLFLMQDWDAALSMYRLIRDDYKSDRALAHYASVQEMMALCVHQMDPYCRAKETFSYLETALLSYTRAAEEERSQMNKDSSARPTMAPHSTRLATRLCLIVAAASDALTKYREVEVADLLASASSHESNLGAAVLLEQSSAFYYEAGMYRKYAFHILMSGHMFRTAGQDHHAFRCFTSALYVYRNGGWDELHNHLRSALAAQLYTMRRMSVALVLYAKLVGTGSGGKVSAKSQQKFLQHLLEICEDHQKAALAGADRMASPPNIPINQREAFRSAQLEKIVNIVRYNRTASRVLELPYVNLPQIVDSSVQVWTHAEHHFQEARAGEEGEAVGVEQPRTEEFGKASKGQDSVWDELELMALGELRACHSSKPQLDETITAALAKISNPTHRKVIAEIDKEKQTRSLIERSKKNGSSRPCPMVRARGEPMVCEFLMRNPLGVDVEVTQVQLVLQMTDCEGRICTNQFAIDMRDEGDVGSSRSWTFACTERLKFSVPEFCRLSESCTRVCKPAKINPFFVVTKHDVVLPAGGETLLSLGLTPLVEGDLEILGVRSKLLDRVWVYHPFDIQGPLLRDTRANIMNRVRGKSLLLKAKIECDMPCLSAELVKRVENDSPVVTSDGGPLLEGQLTSWTLRLRNFGSAPASSVMLKTNLPWIRLLEKDDSLPGLEKDFKATSSCIGPSGTMMNLPLAEGSEVIQPGETVDVPVQIRTSSGFKEQDFYMLYRYELHNSREDSKQRFRWLRKMYTVPVYPSLYLTAKTLTTTLNGKDALLSVELTNNRTDRPTDLFVTLDNLGLASRHYRLEALPGQFTTGEQFGNVLQFGWQERVTLHYKVIKIDNPEQDCLVSKCAFTESGKSSTKLCADSFAVGYLCLEQAFESFEATWKSHQLELFRIENAPESEKEHPRSIASIRRANTSDTGSSELDGEMMDCHPTSIASLFPQDLGASMVHLICSWRAILGQEVVRGEHHIRQVMVRPLKAFHGCPVSVTVSHPTTVSHDFGNGPAYVPLQIRLSNRLLETPVNFLYSLDPSSCDLIGTKTHCFNLEPNGEVSLSLQALIARPGIFDLQALRLSVRQGNEDLSYQFSQQWLVSVKSTSSLLEAAA